MPLSILEIFQNVSGRIGLDKPTAVFSSTDREHFELGVVANDMGRRIARAYEWQAMKKLKTMTGDGATEDFDLPADYDRMLRKAQVWHSTLIRPLTHVISTDEWLELTVRNFTTGINAWTIYDNQIHFKPALDDTVTAKFFYVCNCWAYDQSSMVKETFDTDTDYFVLDPSVLELGIIWQWKANKGLPYAEDMETYNRELDGRITEDKGSRTLLVGNRRVPSGVTVAYPIPVDA